MKSISFPCKNNPEAWTTSLFDKIVRKAGTKRYRNSLKSTIQMMLCLALVCQNLFFFGGQVVNAQTRDGSKKPFSRFKNLPDESAVGRNVTLNSPAHQQKQTGETGTRGMVSAASSVNVREIVERQAKLAFNKTIPEEQLRDRAKIAKDKNKPYNGREIGKPKPPMPDLDLPFGAKLLGKEDFPASFNNLISAPQVASPSPAISFEGLIDNFQTIPPDTMGAVGPNHVVTTLNDRMSIQNRSGGPISTFSTDSFWEPLENTTTVPYTLDTFDPKIYFDRVSNRWIYSITANARNANSVVLLAVSKTPDPTGSWSLYGVDVDSANTIWADYPSVGFNGKWIVIQLNMFTNAANAFVRPDIYVFNKAQAVAGLSSLGFTKFTGNNTGAPTAITGGTWAPSIDPANSSPNAMWFAQSWSSISGLIRISKLTGAVGSETITPGTQFPQSTESWGSGQFLLNGGWAPQGNDTQTAPTTTYLSANDSRMQNLVYRGGSLWATHTVFEPTAHQPAGTATNTTGHPVNHSAIQWWQISSIIETSTVSVPLQRGLIEDTTANNCHNGAGALTAGCTPSGTFYAFPNIAVNDLNDVLIGFSRFNALAWAGSAYAYRDHTDALNTFRDPFLYKAGEGRYAKQGNGDVRWGDYSSAMVDPNNDRSFWTAQEFAAPRANAGNTSVWSTYWAQVNSLTARNSHYITGAVNYGTTPVGQPAKLVSGVLLSATGPSSVSDNLDLAGGYLLNNLNDGGLYTVTPTKSGNINGISGGDATLVLRCLAVETANCTLTANQRIAGDADGNGKLSPIDATMILRYAAANGTTVQGQIGNWKFFPENRIYPPLNANIIGDNYTAFLVGDVNGNWTP